MRGVGEREVSWIRCLRRGAVTTTTDGQLGVGDGGTDRQAGRQACGTWTFLLWQRTALYTRQAAAGSNLCAGPWASPHSVLLRSALAPPVPSR